MNKINRSDISRSVSIALAACGLFLIILLSSIPLHQLLTPLIIGGVAIAGLVTGAASLVYDLSSSDRLLRARGEKMLTPSEIQEGTAAINRSLSVISIVPMIAAAVILMGLVLYAVVVGIS